MNLFDQIVQNASNPFTAKPVTSNVPSFSTPQAPRTQSYVQPQAPVTPANVARTRAPGYEDVVDTTQSPLFKATQGVANMFASTPEPVKNPAAEQMKAKFGFDDKDIEFLRQAKQKGLDPQAAFEFISNKKQEQKQNVYGESVDNPLFNFVGGVVSEVPKVAGEAASFITKAGQYLPGNVIGTAIKAGLSDKTYGQLREEQKAGAEQLATAGQTGKEFVQKYGAFNPESTGAKVGETITDIGATFVGPNKVGMISKLGKLAKPAQVALEGGLAGAKYGIASEGKIDPVDVASGAGGNLAIAGAFRGGQKIARLITPKTAEQKIIESVGGNTVKGIVQGKKVNIQEPSEGIITKISTPFRAKDSKILTGRALTPSYAGKTPKQMLKSIGDMTENVKSLYEQVRIGKIKGNVNTLEDAANTVVSNLDSIGANIGGAVKGAKGTTTLSMGTRADMSRALRNKIEKRAGAYQSLQNFYKDTAKGLNLNDAFKAKRVYQTEIGKLIRSGDAGTDSYSALVKGVQELSDNIDNVVEKSLGSKQFIEWKKQYKLLKSIASDISKSAVVEGRRSPQTFVEQLGMLESIVEGVTNPISTAKAVFAKEIGELNTRGGAWKELIKNYDKQAIEMAKKITPKKIKVGQ